MSTTMTCKDAISMLLAFPADARVVTCHDGKIMPCFDAHRIVDTQDLQGVEIGSGWIELSGLSDRDQEEIIIASRLVDQLMEENGDRSLFCFVDGDYYPIAGIRPLPSSMGMEGVLVELICGKGDVE